MSDEAFVGEEELDPNVLPNGTRVTRDSKKPVELIKEKNYKFKLSHFKNDLLHWINSGMFRLTFFWFSHIFKKKSFTFR